MNKNLNKLSLSPIRYFSNQLSSEKQNVDLTLGEGHFDSPFSAKLYAYEALINNNTRYSRIDGDLNLRKKILNKYYPNYTNENSIVITNGTTQGLFSVLLSLINENDEVIVLSPHYPTYEQVVVNLGGKAVIIDTSINNFKINVDLLKQHVTENTKAIIINEPCNPTGIIYSTDEKRELINYLQNEKLYIIIDELYSLYTPDEFEPYSKLIFDYDKNLIDRFIFVNGLSKSHMMTGYRIGFVVSNEEFCRELSKINFLSISCVSTIMQQAAIGAISEEDFCQFIKGYYMNNVEILTSTLKHLKIPYVDGKGAYYVFMDVSPLNFNGDGFCQYFLDTYNVALVPGKYFGNYNQYVRVSCCKDVKDIIKFVNFLTDFCEKL